MSDPSSPAEPTGLSVRVLRSGGFAGLTRRWEVELPASDADAWIVLVDSCPWPDRVSESAAEGADRFVWQVTVWLPPSDDRIAVLGDDEITGPWSELIDAVREAAREPRERSGGVSGGGGTSLSI